MDGLAGVGRRRLRTLRRNRWVRAAWGWSSQFCDPLLLAEGVRNLPGFVRDWRAYARLPGAEPMRVADAMPLLHDKRSRTPFDAHYFYVNGWAMRRIVAAAPDRHVDVGSQVVFANLLAAVVPVTFVDLRPLEARISGLDPIGGDIRSLPFADESIASLSCLHVAEHVGLGRYGDPLDPGGTRRAAAELARVLAPGGRLYFAVPVGRPRLCFNAHRIHDAPTVRAYFPDLELVEHSGVHDDATYVERVDLGEFGGSSYACGMFAFVKPNG